MPTTSMCLVFIVGGKSGAENRAKENGVANTETERARPRSRVESSKTFHSKAGQLRVSTVLREVETQKKTKGGREKARESGRKRGQAQEPRADGTIPKKKGLPAG